MPWKEKEVEKIYWSIGEVAERFHVAASLLRFWEEEFCLFIKKNRNGNRKYTKYDIERIEKIYHLVKVRKFTLEGAHMELWLSELKNPVTLP